MTAQHTLPADAARPPRLPGPHGGARHAVWRRYRNAASLRPLIAQVEFAKEDAACVVALIVALATGGQRAAHLGSGTGGYFYAVIAWQLAAIACMLAGRRAGP